MRIAALILGLVSALTASGATLTFDEALARANRAHAIGDLPEDALQILENPGGFEWPLVRVEGQLNNARSLDVFNENRIHNQVFSAIVSVDYPLLDGGASAIRRRASALSAATLRERMHERAGDVFRETVDAVARLYTAQERRKILQRGYERTLAMRQRANELLEVHEISNTTAAQWQDDAIAAEAELIDLDLERLDAETRLKQLIGDTTGEPIEIMLEESVTRTLVSVSPAQTGVSVPHPQIEQRALALEEARAVRRPQVMLSAFGGVAGEDRYALYGLRMTIALPMFDATLRRREAQARVEAAEAELARTAAAERERREASLLSLNVAGLEKRIELLARGVEVAKLRSDSVARLHSGGLRSESALAGTLVDIGRRESQLLAARVDLWRHLQRMRAR